MYHGVPMLCIPFFADQKYNAKKIVTEEIGLQLSFKELTKETLLTTMHKMLNDSRYVQVKFVDAMGPDLKMKLYRRTKEADIKG